MGFAAFESTAVAGSSTYSMRRTGGLGKFLVERPVVSALYGTGGGAGLRAASSIARASSSSLICFAWASSAERGAPSLLLSGVTVCGTAAPP